jgi:hypothetical protein
MNTEDGRGLNVLVSVLLCMQVSGKNTTETTDTELKRTVYCINTSMRHKRCEFIRISRNNRNRQNQL